jgi:hypothetical protein
MWTQSWFRMNDKHIPNLMCEHIPTGRKKRKATNENMVTYPWNWKKARIGYKLLLAAADDDNGGYDRVLTTGAAWDVTPCSMVDNEQLYSQYHRRSFDRITGLTGIIVIT